MKLINSKRILLILVLLSYIIQIMNISIKKQTANIQKKQLISQNALMRNQIIQHEGANNDNSQIIQYQNEIMKKIIEKKALLNNILKNANLGTDNYKSFNNRNQNINNDFNNPYANRISSDQASKESSFLAQFSDIIGFEIDKKLDTLKNEITDEIKEDLKTIFSMNKGVLEKINDIERKKKKILKSYKTNELVKNSDQSFIEDNLEDEVDYKLKENINSLNKAFENKEKIKFKKKKSNEEKKIDSLNSVNNKTDHFIDDDTETLNLNDYSLDKLL